METDLLCSCGSEVLFSDCCQPFITQKKFPSTPEQLMRSRYVAYAHCEINYLLSTTHPSTRKYYRSKEIEKWAKENQWLKLEIVEAVSDTVEFKAFYKDGMGHLQIHHEKSTFLIEAGRWYFVDGIFGDEI